MIQEIYIRQPEDPKYIDTKLDTSDEYEMLTSKILMILNTRKGEVFGDQNFGVNLEDRLFSFAIDEEALKREIFDQVQLYIPESNKFNIQINVSRFKGSVRDIILLDFIIDGRKLFGVMVK
jgi:hypothetical protein